MRKILFFTLSIGFWLHSLYAEASEGDTKPNIIWIFVEDMNALSISEISLLIARLCKLNTVMAVRMLTI